MPRFLSLGECMVEMTPEESGLFRMGFAGDTFNTAWYARRQLPEDWSVGYASAVGTDAASDRMLAFMSGEGIDTSAMRRVEGRTVGLYMISLEQGERSFSYWRGQSAARTLADDPDWLAGTLGRADAIYFSGITLAILTPDARERLCDALASARAAGTPVAFDTNLRPTLWGDTQTMKDGITRGAGIADIVLPSFDEDGALFGDSSPEDTIARYRAGGASCVCVKNGADPLHVWTAEDGLSTHDPVPAVNIVDTTAAGDSFGAAFFAARLTGATQDQAALRAMALSARVVGARGALVDVG